MLDLCTALYRQRKFIYKDEGTVNRVKNVFKELRSFYIELLSEVLVNCQEDLLSSVIKIERIDSNFYKQRLIDYFDSKIVLSKTKIPSFLSAYVDTVEKLIFESFILKFMRYANPETLLTDNNPAGILHQDITRHMSVEQSLSDFELFMLSKSVTKKCIGFYDKTNFSKHDVGLNLFGINFSQNFIFLNKTSTLAIECEEDNIHISLESISNTNNMNHTQINTVNNFTTPSTLIETSYRIETSLANIYNTSINHRTLFKLIASVYFLRTTVTEITESLVSIFDYSVKLPKHMLLSGIRDFITANIEHYFSKSELRNNFQVAYNNRSTNPGVLITFKWDFPFYYIVNESSIKKYNQVFNHVLQVRKIERGNSNVYLKTKNRKTIDNLGLDAQDKTRLNDPSCIIAVKKLLSQINALKTKVACFINSYNFYIEEKVLGYETRKFNTQLDSCNDFKQIKLIHDAYINNICAKMFITDDTLSIYRKIISILDSAVNFFLLVDNFDNTLCFSQSIKRDLSALSLLIVKRNNEVDSKQRNLMQAIRDLETNANYGLCRLISL